MAMKTAAARAPRQIKVLIIDDERDLVEMLSLRFASTGAFRVETAFDGDDGLEKVKAFRPDVVLLDLVMPKVDGWEVCRRLRADPSTANLPVVMMTGKSGIAPMSGPHPAGVHRVLLKPFDLADIVKTLLNAVPRRG